MQQYLDLLEHVMLNGVRKSDRTGTGTRSIFGHQMRFDLRKGFPAITTKRLFMRGMVAELLWFLSGSTDAKVLQDQNVRFWDSWLDDEGTIGHGYGKQFRNLTAFTPVRPKIYEAPESLQRVYLGDLPEPNYASDTGTTVFKVGQEIETILNGTLIILEELPANDKLPRIHWRVGFKDTGYIRKADYGSLQTRKVRDVYRRSVFGVGYYGECDTSDPHFPVLEKAWREMLRRCYWEKAGQYKSYGAKGVHVDEPWHCLANFLADAKRLPGWPCKAEYGDEYSLDKDVRWASNRYGKDTCKWASHAEQSANTSTNRYFVATAPSGEKVSFTSVTEAQREHGLNNSAVHRCLNGQLRKHHGWHSFHYIEAPEGVVLRANIVDQVKEVIAGIKHDPDSRRHMISLWNPYDVERTTLPPCHGSVIQFWVADGRLSSNVYQRSADVMLGVPVNIASYALLTHMVAQQCNLGVGEFIWTGGDCHLYENHMEQAREQLQRLPYPLPGLCLTKSESIFDYQPSDIWLSDYHCHPAIKAPVAV